MFVRKPAKVRDVPTCLLVIGDVSNTDYNDLSSSIYTID